MRKFLIALVIFLGIVFILGRISEVETMVMTLRRGDIRFILLALLCLAIWLVNVAASYRAVLRVVGIDEQLKDLIPLAAASYFTNIVTPTGGASGAALLMSEARKRKFSTARSMVARGRAAPGQGQTTGVARRAQLQHACDRRSNRSPSISCPDADQASSGLPERAL